MQNILLIMTSVEILIIGNRLDINCISFPVLSAVINALKSKNKG